MTLYHQEEFVSGWDPLQYEELKTTYCSFINSQLWFRLHLRTRLKSRQSDLEGPEQVGTVSHHVEM